MAVRLGPVLVSIFVLTLAVNSRAQCPKGWTSAGYNCFKAFDEPKTWKDAESHCQSLSHEEKKAHLTSVSDIPENILLKAWLESKGSNVTDPWIGLKPVADVGDALDDTWADGSPADLMIWLEEGILDDEFMFMTQMCLVQRSSDGTWVPTECNKLRPYVCKLSTCPGGWVPYGGRCYHAFQAKKPWVHAEKHCRSFSKNVEAHLAGIADNMENRFLLTITKDDPQPIWIGMKGVNDDGVTSVWSEDEGFDLATVDSTDSVKNNTCVQMLVDDDIVWQDASCKDEMPYVCKLSMCRRGWTAIEGTCMWYTSQKPTQQRSDTSKVSTGARKRVRRGFNFKGFGSLGRLGRLSPQTKTKSSNTQVKQPKNFPFQRTFTSSSSSSYIARAQESGSQATANALPPIPREVPEELKPSAILQGLSTNNDKMRCLGQWNPMGNDCRRTWNFPKNFQEAMKHCESFTYTGDTEKQQAILKLTSPEEKSWNQKPHELRPYTCTMRKVLKNILI